MRLSAKNFTKAMGYVAAVAPSPAFLAVAQSTLEKMATKRNVNLRDSSEEGD